MKRVTSFLTIGILALALGACQSATNSDRISVANSDTDLPPIDRSVRPEAGPLPEAAFPEYETVVLDNGLTLYLIPSQRQPTITYRLMLRSGGLYDGDKVGLSELVADMLPKGAAGRTAFEIADETDFIGGTIGTESTSDFTAVTVSGLSKYEDQLLDTLADLALQPTFDEGELEKLKERYVSSLQSERQNPSAMVGLLRRQLVYGENGYGSIKTEASLDSIGVPDLAAFHEQHFLPNNASLAIVGDFEPASMVQLVEARLADWQEGEVEPLPELEFPEIDGLSLHIVDRPNSVQSAIRVAQQSVSRSDPDVPELRVLMSILGGGSSGRMFLNLREDKGYTYGAFSSAANAAHFGAILTAVEVRNEVTAAAIREIIAELSRIRSEPIGSNELERHRKYLAGNYIMSLESAENTAARVQEIDIYGLEPDFYRSYLTVLAAITPESLSALAKRLIEEERLVVAIVGSADAIAESVSEFGPVTIYNDRLEPVETRP